MVLSMVLSLLGCLAGLPFPYVGLTSAPEDERGRKRERERERESESESDKDKSRASVRE